MANNQVPSVQPDKRAAIDAFRKKLADQAAGVAPGQRGRIVVALDATASRQPTWDVACRIQSEMFEEVARVGGLQIQLVFYRGHEFESCEWVSDSRVLAEKMEKIDCRGGNTQIEKVLIHALRENGRRKIQGLVFVGDAMEEDPAALFAVARELGSANCPTFLFQEGDHPRVSQVFAEIVRLTKGAHCSFSPGAARELAELLRAVARYAAGGLKALQSSQSAGAVKLLKHFK